MTVTLLFSLTDYSGKCWARTLGKLLLPLGNFFHSCLCRREDVKGSSVGDTQRTRLGGGTQSFQESGKHEWNGTSSLGHGHHLGWKVTKGRGSRGPGLLPTHSLTSLGLEHTCITTTTIAITGAATIVATTSSISTANATATTTISVNKTCVTVVA